MITLSEVRSMEGETFDSLLRRFNKRVQQDGVLSDARARSHFLPPSVIKKKKNAAKIRKSQKTNLGKTPRKFTPRVAPR